MNMDAQPTCPECGATLPGGSPGAACPACLFKFAMATGAPAESPPPAPEPADLQPWFPDLEIIKMLGRGGMGVVYLVRQPSLDRLAALKILPVDLGIREGFRDRFLREARTLAALVHPNIVTIHDFGERGGYFFFLMEYVGGGDLATAMADGSLTPEAALALVPPLCEALQYAHDHGVIHRDIKPANILLDLEGRVKVADFGVAKLVDKPGEDGIPADYMLGTPAYMAPEQKAHSLKVDHRADIFSLGVLIHELLTGISPSAEEVPHAHSDHLTHRLEAVINRALAENPDARFQNVRDLAEQIQAALTRSQTLWRRTLAGSAVALLVAAGLFLTLRDSHPPSPALPPVWTNSLGMPFRPLPGSPNLLCIRETTQEDFAECAKDLGWEFPEKGALPGHPITGRANREAVGFCRWLTRRERAAGKLAAGESYRLPTDAEWSAAAGLTEPIGELPFALHLKDKSLYPWGQTAPAPPGAGNYPDSALAARWPKARVIPAYYDGHAFTAPAASFPPDARGFHDLGGNVWELTRTPGADGQMIDAWRGGSWNSGAKDGNWEILLASFRMKDGDGLLTEKGFRIVLDRQTQPPVSLLAAIRAGDRQTARDLMAKKSGINDKDGEGASPLLAAAEEADLEILQALLDAGADLSHRDKQGQSALHPAARRGDVAVVRLLLDKGTNPRETDKTLRRPLHYAAAAGHTDVVALLAEAGAANMTADYLGQNPLDLAAIHGHEDTLLWILDHPGAEAIAEPVLSRALSLAVAGNQYKICAILLDRGAKVTDAKGDCPALRAAACLGRGEIFFLLLSRLEGKPPEDLLISAASSAVNRLAVQGFKGESDINWQDVADVLDSSRFYKSGDKSAIIHALLERGVPIEYRNDKGFTALLTAAYHGETEFVRTLLERGADIRAVDNEGFSALHSAAEHNHAAAVECLLAAGADFSVPTKDGRTALGVAALGGHVAAAKLLLQAGADPTQLSSTMPPLNIAAQRGLKEMIKLLLENGADPNQLSENKLSALDMACLGPDGSRKAHERQMLAVLPKQDVLDMRPDRTEEDFMECIRLLVAAGARVNPSSPLERTPLHVAAGYDFEAAARFLIEKGAVIDAPGPDVTTPLGFAAGTNSLRTARLLLEKGAKHSPPHIVDAPIHRAARAGHTSMVELLLDHGADPNLKDGKSATALHWAIIGGHDGVVKVLARRGADLGVRDVGYNTPLHLAANYPSTQVVRTLLDAGADPLARNLEGATPLQIARFKNRTIHLEALEQAEAKARSKP
jgi:ankyrin repeat protein